MIKQITKTTKYDAVFCDFCNGEVKEKDGETYQTYFQKQDNKKEKPVHIHTGCLENIVVDKFVEKIK
ncbi:hypothetical protein KKF61_07475 [Patescibacteria group bacterium]|nr:hypothetical protein [Patescibacteria group bacterium]